MYIILAQCYIHMEKTCMEYILSLFLTSWRGIRKVWRELCTSLHVYYISIRSLLLIYLKFIALDTIQWWRVRSRSYLFSSPRDSLVWNIRESGLWTFPKLDGEGGWQLSELVCITRFSNGCFLSWYNGSSFLPLSPRVECFQNGISSLGSKVIKYALSLVERKKRKQNLALPWVS